MTPAPIRQGPDISSDGKTTIWPQPWANWFKAIVNAVKAWNASFTTTVTHDFGSISTDSEASTTVTMAGVVSTGTPSVLVTPSVNTAGIVYSGVVTKADTVVIYAKNMTSGSIDPASTTFRVVVIQ